MSNLNKSELDELDEFELEDDFGDECTTIETFSSDGELKMFNIDEMLHPHSKNIIQDEDIELNDNKILQKENVEYVTEHSVSEKTIQTVKKIIDGIEVVVKTMIEETQNELKPREKIRTYSKKSNMEKTVYRKPKKAGSFLSKLIMFIFACIATGIFLGLQANSYYIFKGGKVESSFSCVFSWLMEENMPFTVSPINGDVFGTGFFTGFCVLAVIGLLIYLDSDAKKQSRVGHEHGKARLATPRDFKKFKNRFMEK